MKKFLIIIFLTFNLSGYTQNTDIEILKNINLNRNKQLDWIFRDITNSASPIAYGVPIILLFIGIIKKRTQIKQSAYYIVAAILTSAIISNIIKYSIHRPRPFITYPLIEKLSSGGSPSFASGHTADAFALASAICIIYPKWYVLVPLYTWALVVGYSRMHLGVHYPSDVLMGAIIGAGSAYMCYLGKQWLNKSNSDNEIS